MRTDAASSSALREVGLLFLKLGFVAFGGPAAHMALMRQEVVVRRRWLTDQAFLDLLGASNLIPGPTSTELAIYIGYVRAGPWGLVLAGCLFICPAMLMVLGLAWAYVELGATPAAGALFYGVKPVIIAVVAQALWSLGRTAVKSRSLAAVGVACVALFALGLSPLVVLAVGVTAGILRDAALRRLAVAVLTPSGLPYGLAVQPAPPGLASFSLLTLFVTFLKIGAVLYGSGYVLLAFLRDDFVGGLGWLTDQQLIDAVAVGQFTPGPVFTTATFIGYVVGGLPGALVATVAVFLPSFLFVAAVYPLIPRVKASSWARAALDGVNVAALALMAGVTWQLGRAALVDAPTVLLALAALALLLRLKVNSAWLVLGGAAAGYAIKVVAGAAVG